MALVVSAGACASMPNSGPLAEGSPASPRIGTIDTAAPPRFAWVQLDRTEYAVLLLVAPGHSATLLYPPDSATDNNLSAGSHQLTFRIPQVLVMVDSARTPDRNSPRTRADSARYPGRTDPSTGRTARTMSAIAPATPVYMLLVTSPQPIAYKRVIEKTAGVSNPSVEMEALN